MRSQFVRKTARYKNTVLQLKKTFLKRLSICLWGLVLRNSDTEELSYFYIYILDLYRPVHKYHWCVLECAVQLRVLRGVYQIGCLPKCSVHANVLFHDISAFMVSLQHFRLNWNILKGNNIIVNHALCGPLQLILKVLGRHASHFSLLF